MASRVVIALGLFLGIPCALQAATEVSGVIETSDWEPAEGPYRATGDLLVPVGATLKIWPGVQVAFDPDVSLVVEGALEVLGTTAQPVEFVRHDPDEAWGGVAFTGTEARGDLVELELAGASSFQAEGSTRPAAFSTVRGARVVISNCWFHDFPAVVFENATGAELQLLDSVIERSMEAVHSAESYARVEGVTIRDVVGYSDCIDFDGDSVPQSVIRNVRLENNEEDDGIDLASANALIEDVIITGIGNGKAISVDGESSPLFRRVLIHDCMLGIVSKDSCTPVFEQCTVARCETAVSCYEKTRGRGGGHGTADSMIIWGNGESVDLDQLSSFTMTYSIVEGGYPGEQNIDQDPLFVDPELRDFHPLPTSPAVDAGKDGVTMGALPVAGPSLQSFIRGETNGDLSVDIGDAVTILLFLFEGRPSVPCLDALDVDDTGQIDVSDAVILLQYLFLAGAPPSAPFPQPGPDPTGDDPYTCPVD